MLPGRSSRITSVASAATEVRNAAPSGVMSSLRSMPHSLASRPGARGPLSRTRARPWVWSTQVTGSPGAWAARRSGSRSTARPGAASSSHSPGPEPATSVPARSLTARPNRTPSAAAPCPPTGARSWTLVSGVQSVSVSSASARRPLTSQPSCTTTGGAGAIGLRAMMPFSNTIRLSATAVSDTHPPSVRVDVGMLRLDPGRDLAAVGQPHNDHGAGPGQARLDLGQADRPAQRRRHPAGGDPPGDHGTVHDQARLLGHHRPVDRLQPDQPGPAAALPRQLRLADEVVLVQLDRPVQPGAEAPGQAVGVLADDEVALLQPQDPLGLDAERGRAQVLAVLQQRLPDVQP